MKEALKSKKGITLIALVITIIVLIILAGISISLLMGEDGIITKAKQGALNYQNAAIEEQAMLNNLYGDFASEIASATGDLSTLTHIDNTNAATSDKILKDYKAYVNGELLTGTMNNYSSNPEKITLTAEQNGETTIDIADGYHTDIKVDASAVYEAGVAAGNTGSQLKQSSICYNYGILQVWDENMNLITENGNIYSSNLETEYISYRYNTSTYYYSFYALKPGNYYITTESYGNAAMTNHNVYKFILTDEDVYPYLIVNTEQQIISVNVFE